MFLKKKKTRLLTYTERLNHGYFLSSTRIGNGERWTLYDNKIRTYTAVVSYKRIRVSRGKGTEGRVLRTHQTLVSGDPFFLGPGSVTIAVEQQRFQLVFLAHDGRRAWCAFTWRSEEEQGAGNERSLSAGP